MRIALRHRPQERRDPGRQHPGGEIGFSCASGGSRDLTNDMSSVADTSQNRGPRGKNSRYRRQKMMQSSREGSAGRLRDDSNASWSSGFNEHCRSVSQISLKDFASHTTEVITRSLQAERLLAAAPPYIDVMQNRANAYYLVSHIVFIPGDSYVPLLATAPLFITMLIQNQADYTTLKKQIFHDPYSQFSVPS